MIHEKKVVETKDKKRGKEEEEEKKNFRILNLQNLLTP